MKNGTSIFAKIASFFPFLSQVLAFSSLFVAAGYAQSEKTEPLRKVSCPTPIETSWSDLTAGIENEQQWLQHKAILKLRFLDLIRDQHKPSKPALDLKIHDEVNVDGIYIRKRIRYAVESDQRAVACLAIPPKIVELGL